MELKKIFKSFLKKIKHIFLYKHTGIYKIKKIKTSSGEILNKKIIKNTITNIALNEMNKIFSGNAVDMEMKELAIGTGSTTPSTSNTTLETEVYRTTKTDQNTTDTGQTTTEFVLNGSEYAGDIKEIGLFGSSTADPWSGGTGKDTGLLISRVLYDDTLAVDESIYIQRIDQIS